MGKHNRTLAKVGDTVSYKRKLYTVSALVTVGTGTTWYRFKELDWLILATLCKPLGLAHNEHSVMNGARDNGEV